ncbi:DUF2849 domain-containing protein [Acetobacter sp. LMG 1636]|uniref:DUF2849 domain-containing protein n=1 Tax=Acetobacter fallax TaxID=1737473 RepID=A0ABX0KAW9_9PROT|nr:DUF2849 domain-containing protein [Acetobacter fallax]NHO35209.1 DUF2849 domain-containing protein [Acetobacter fallax]
MDIRSNRRDADGQSVITANRLLDGIVVWRAADGTWCELISDATQIPNGEVENLLNIVKPEAQNQGVLGVYGVQVRENDVGEIVPVTARERIRAFGPSIHPEFAPRDHAAMHDVGENRHVC